MIQSSRFTIGAAMAAVACCYGPVHAAPSAVAPSATRYIVKVPEALTPRYPDWINDGSLVFASQPATGGRSEIYQINEDGSKVACLSCGVAPNVADDLSKPFVFKDGSHRILVRVGKQSARESTLLPVTVPAASGGQVIQPQREIRIAPDGRHVGLTQVILGADNIAHYVAVVGTLRRSADEYLVDDARVIASDTEMKRFSSDGKKAFVATFQGVYDQGNADGQAVDLATGSTSRLTASTDYDEDVSDSPNGQWLAIGSSRTLHYTTAMSQIRRPTFVPAYIVGPMFTMQKGTTNQQWVNSRTDELQGKDGIQLWVADDGWTSLPVGNWNSDGSAVTFWETTNGLDNPENSRIVIAHLSNSDSVGAGPDDVTTPEPTWATPLADFVPPGLDEILIAAGTYAGEISGSATIEESTNSNTGMIHRIVTYNQLQHVTGQVIDGTETAVYSASLNSIVYTGNLTVRNVDGAKIGWLTAQNVIITTQTSITGTISSTLDGETISMTAENGTLTIEASPIPPAKPY